MTKDPKVLLEAKHYLTKSTSFPDSKPIVEDCERALRGVKFAS